MPCLPCQPMAPFYNKPSKRTPSQGKGLSDACEEADNVKQWQTFNGSLMSSVWHQPLITSLVPIKVFPDSVYVPYHTPVPHCKCLKLCHPIPRWAADRAN